MNCPKCSKKAPAESDGCMCSKCRLVLHYSECSGVSKESWRSMGTNRRAEWICPVCREPGSASKQTKTPTVTDKVNQDPDKDFQFEKSSFNALKKFLSSEIAGMEGRIMKEMINKFNDFQASLEFNSGKIGDLEKTMKSVEQNIIVMERKQIKLENENVEIKSRLRKLETEMQIQIQENNNNKMELSGLPTLVNVNVKEVANQFLQKVGIPLADVGPYQVDKPFKPEASKAKSSVVITFQNQGIRDNIMKKVKQDKIYLKAKDIITDSTEETNVYVNEHLSNYYRKLFYEANIIKKQKLYSYLWVREGKIFLKKKEGDRVVRLSNMDDLGKI